VVIYGRLEGVNMERMSEDDVARAFERLGLAKEEERDRLKFREIEELNSEPEKEDEVTRLWSSSQLPAKGAS
jgi:hypothetical protein